MLMKIKLKSSKINKKINCEGKKTQQLKLLQDWKTKIAGKFLILILTKLKTKILTIQRLWENSNWDKWNSQIVSKKKLCGGPWRKKLIFDKIQQNCEEENKLLEKSKCDKTKKLKLIQSSRTQIVRGKKIKTQIVTKLDDSNSAKSPKLKFWQLNLWLNFKQIFWSEQLDTWTNNGMYSGHVCVCTI